MTRSRLAVAVLAIVLVAFAWASTEVFRVDQREEAAIDSLSDALGGGVQIAEIRIVFNVRLTRYLLLPSRLYRDSELKEIALASKSMPRLIGIVGISRAASKPKMVEWGMPSRVDLVDSVHGSAITFRSISR